MRAIGKSCHWRGRGEVLLGRSLVASFGETGVDRLSCKEY